MRRPAERGDAIFIIENMFEVRYFVARGALRRAHFDVFCLLRPGIFPPAPPLTGKMAWVGAFCEIDLIAGSAWHAGNRPGEPGWILHSLLRWLDGVERLSRPEWTTAKRKAHVEWSSELFNKQPIQWILFV